MAKSNIRKQKKRGRGRPPKPGGIDPVLSARIPVALVKVVDAWGDKNNAQSRQEALKMTIAAYSAWQPLTDYLRECAKNEPKTADERQQRNNRALELQNQAFETLKRLGLA